MAQQDDSQKMENSKENTIVMDQQINVARSELKNLRHQIQSLGHVHKKEMEHIKDMLNFPEMLLLQSPPNLLEGNRVSTSEQQPSDPKLADKISFQVIGHVSTWFSEKRATPRQPGICKSSRGKLELSKDLFTNPEHSLEGLASFSHLWLIFFFHKNAAAHSKAKVAPPRLNGERVGVFGTRSPHRPSPIGLSLVKIEEIQGSTIFFSGCDLVDGTPVLDVKPYIPAYDSPWCVGQDEADEGDEISESGPLTEAAGEELPTPSSSLSQQHTPTKSINMREEPDGEEEVPGAVGGVSKQTASAASTPTTTVNGAEPTVRVPSWIEQPPVMRLNVRYSERAVIQIVENCENTKTMILAISSVLREDPRSVYLRERWANHFYSFLIKDLHISCKFDDRAKVVTVFQIKPAKKCNKCGEMEWQCSNTCNDK